MVAPPNVGLTLEVQLKKYNASLAAPDDYLTITTRTPYSASTIPIFSADSGVKNPFTSSTMRSPEA